jgi:hypothetical protein
MDEIQWLGLIRIILVSRDGTTERIPEHVQISIDDELLVVGAECKAKLENEDIFWIRVLSITPGASFSAVPEIMAMRVDNVDECIRDLREEAHPVVPG